MTFPLNARAQGLAMAIMALLASAAFSNSTAVAKDLKRALRENVVEEIEAPSRRSYEEIIVQLPPLVRRKAAAIAPAVTANAKKSEPDAGNAAAAPPQSTPPAPPPEVAAKAQEAPAPTAPLEQAANEVAVPKDANLTAPAEVKPASAPVANGAEQSAPAPFSGPALSVEGASEPIAADAQTAPAPQSAPEPEKPAVILPEPPAAASAQPDGSAEVNADAEPGQLPQAMPPAPLSDAEPATSAPSSGQPAPSIGATDAADGAPAPAPAAQAEPPAQSEREHVAREGAGAAGAIIAGLAASIAMTGILAFWLLRRKAGAKAPKAGVEKPAGEGDEEKLGAKAPIWARIAAGLRARFHAARENGGDAAQFARTKAAGASNAQRESVALDASGSKEAAAKTPIWTRLAPSLTFGGTSAEGVGSPVGSAAQISAMAAGANANEVERWLGGGVDGLELLEPKQCETSEIVAKARRSLRQARA